MLAALTLAGLNLLDEGGPRSVIEDDVELAAAVARGDRAASEQLVRRALPIARRAARAMIRDAAEVDDATQVALLELLQSAGGFRGTGSLDGWIRTLATRSALRLAQRARSSRLRAVSVAQSDDAPGPAMNTTVLESLPRPLEAYLSELPPVQRTALVLRHALGHTLVEIAELTESPVPTVRSRLKKAQDEVRRRIRRDVQMGTASRRGR